MRGRPEVSGYTGMAAPYLPLVLLAMFLQSVLGRGGGAMLLSFSPAEVDFLFAAPFRRRDLLLFKLVRKGMGLVVGSLAMSLTPFLMFFNDWLSMFVGVALALAFVMLASLAAALGRLIISEAAHTRARRVVLYAMTTLAAVALPRTVSTRQGVPVLGTGGELPGDVAGAGAAGSVRGLQQRHARRAMVPRPARLGRGGGGDRPGACWRWSCGSMPIISSGPRRSASGLTSSSRRMRRTGGLAVAHRGGASRFRFPQLPWLGGAGPIAWRQLVQTSRTAWELIIMMLMFTVGLLILELVSPRSDRPTALPTALLALGLVSYFSYIFGLGFPVAFRGDVNQLDFLKTLPVHPLAMAVGELAGPAIILSADRRSRS